MGSVLACRACFGLFEMMIFRLLHNPLPLASSAPKANEPQRIFCCCFFRFFLSFGGFGASLSSSGKSPLGTHKIAISRRRQSFKCNLVEAPSLADLWINNFCEISLSHLPGSIPSLERKKHMMILGFLRILMIDDCLIWLLQQSLRSYMSKVIAS